VFRTDEKYAGKPATAQWFEKLTKIGLNRNNADVRAPIPSYFGARTNTKEPTDVLLYGITTFSR